MLQGYSGAGTRRARDVQLGLREIPLQCGLASALALPPSPRIYNVMNIIMKADLDINEGDTRD